MDNCWDSLKNKKKTILALAPLAGFTDSAFRLICRDFGADLVYSEMASVTAINYKPKKTINLLSFREEERPYIVQIFGSNPEHFAQAVKFIEKEIKPDGFDINFGCPVKKVLKQGAGAKLMADLELSRRVIISVLENTNLPLSIKVRTEAFSVNLIDFLKNIEDLPVSAMMIHGRSLKELFSGPIDLDLIKESKKYFSGLILANGGINSLAEANKIVKKTGVDGVGIGRGALGRPWIFSPDLQKIGIRAERDLIRETIEKHFSLVIKNRGEIAFNEFKGHLSWYFKGFAGASKLRSELMLSKSFDELKSVLDRIKKIN